MLVSLVWGSQVMQQIAQHVRVSENKLVMAEKMAAMAKIYGAKHGRRPGWILPGVRCFYHNITIAG
jgi:predicted ATP-dependent Lon-type protease